MPNKRAGVTAFFIVVLILGVPVSAGAGVTPQLPYPKGQPTALEIMQQVYFVNHFYALRNFAITKVRRKITVLISRAKGKRPTTNTLERYLNNDYENDPVIRAKDLAIFRSGKLRGTGLLITDYDDDSKGQSYMIWLPALRKIRRFAQPAQDDSWGGLDFTFGDVVLRKPSDETHEYLGKEIFETCLEGMDIPKKHQNRYTRKLAKKSCASKGKEVYKVKSTTKFENWWYDYRINYVDTTTFADYRTEYYKNGKKIRFIDRDWNSLGLDDPRALAWGYWYGKNFETGHESWAVIPKEVVKYNAKFKPSLWSERTLRKIKR
ncbi:MAG TPA: outer membrane lipoprotein-sorting protein [Thiolapillus brandeum]|uniref:Outer membrane lipoprotein-sorting protein n=1 Tax=Thiolapillus brandeum TaxID=1076588 RepID=A0A831KAY2_9GAMM|nr:outer membrane lipoprotein-sorting protein [Thiolapillus brandeum]